MGFIYDKDSFKIINKFYYNTEGWGITHNHENLIMSDGTDNIYFLNPINFKKVYSIKVHDGFRPVTRLNELEFINEKSMLMYGKVIKLQGFVLIAVK